MSSEGGSGNTAAQSLAEKTMVTVLPLGPKTSPTCKVAPAPTQASTTRKNVPATPVALQQRLAETPAVAPVAASATTASVMHVPKSVAKMANAPAAATKTASAPSTAPTAMTAAGPKSAKSATTSIAVSASAPPAAKTVTSQAVAATAQSPAKTTTQSAAKAVTTTQATVAPSAPKAVAATQSAPTAPAPPPAPKTAAVTVGAQAAKTMQAATVTSAASTSVPVRQLETDGPAAQTGPAPARQHIARPVATPRASRSSPTEKAPAAPQQPRPSGLPGSPSLSEIPFAGGSSFWSQEGVSRATPAAMSPGRDPSAGPPSLPGWRAPTSSTGRAILPGEAASSVRAGNIDSLSSPPAVRDVFRFCEDSSYEGVASKPVVMDMPRRGSFAAPTTMSTTSAMPSAHSPLGPAPSLAHSRSPPRTRYGAPRKLNSASLSPPREVTANETLSGPVTTMRKLASSSAQATQAPLAPATAQAAQVPQATRAPQGAQPVQAPTAPQPAQTMQVSQATQGLQTGQTVQAVQAPQTVQTLQPAQAPQAQVPSLQSRAAARRSTPSPVGMRMARSVVPKTSSRSPLVVRSKSPVGKAFVCPKSVECRAVIVAENQHWHFTSRPGATVNDTISRVTEEVVQIVAAEGERTLGERLLVSAVPSITDSATVADWVQQNSEQPPLIIIESCRNDSIPAERPDLNAQINQVMHNLMNEHRKMLHALQDKEGELSSIIQTQSQFILDLQAKAQQHKTLLSETLEVIAGDVADMRADILHLEEYAADIGTESK